MIQDCCDVMKEFSQLVYYEEDNNGKYFMDQEFRDRVMRLNYCPNCGAKL